MGQLRWLLRRDIELLGIKSSINGVRGMGEKRGVRALGVGSFGYLIYLNFVSRFGDIIL